MKRSEKLEDIGEFGLIDRIRNGCLIRTEGVVTAIGDDAAAFWTPEGCLNLLTTDLLVEGVHFQTDRIDAVDLGHKALAVNLSDIAAMGGQAREAFVSLAVPRSWPLDRLEAIYEGMKRLAAEFDVNILGGDTTGSPNALVISISVAGSVPPEQLLRRSTAAAGDRILVTGTLGDSRAGLRLLLGEAGGGGGEFQRLKAAHLRPTPHLRQGRFLASCGGVHAAIDVSDGLSSDIGHIARASRAGVRLWADRMPVSDELQRFCRDLHLDAADFALAGGEDYVLAVTAAADRAAPIAAAYREVFGTPLYDIGEIVEAGTMEIVCLDGAVRQITAGGWDHFRT